MKQAPLLLLGLAACSLPRSPLRSPPVTALNAVAEVEPPAEFTLTLRPEALGGAAQSVAQPDGFIGLFCSHFRARIDPQGRVRESAFSPEILRRAWPDGQRFVFMDREGELYLAETFLGALRPLGGSDAARVSFTMRGRFTIFDAARIRVLGATGLVSVPLPPESLGASGRGAPRDAWFDSPLVGNALLEDGSTWHTDDGGARWARAPWSERQLSAPPPPQAYTQREFDDAFERATLEREPSLAPFLGGFRTDAGDFVAMLSHHELRVWGSDGVTRLSVPELGESCTVAPWGSAAVVRCAPAPDGALKLWRLRGTTLTPLNVPGLAVLPRVSDDGVHLGFSNRVCNVDSGNCWFCPLDNAVFHGGALYRVAGNELRRCEADGDHAVHFPALDTCRGTLRIASHPEGVAVILRDCLDASSLRVPDQLALLSDTEPEIRSLPFSALSVVSLDARHLAAQAPDGFVEVSDDRGLSWSEMSTPSMSAGFRSLDEARCSGGVCVSREGRFALSFGPRRPDERPEAPPEAPVALAEIHSWLNARAVSCEIETLGAPAPWGDESFSRIEPTAVWHDGSTLRWRTAEGLGAASLRNLHTLFPLDSLDTILPVSANTANLWFGPRTGRINVSVSWSLLHAGVRGVQQALPPRPLSEFPTAAALDSGALIHLQRQASDTLEATTLSPDGAVLAQRPLPIRPPLVESVFAGALDGRPAAVRMELDDDAVRVTAHTVDGAPDRSWRAVFARESSVPWCQSPPTVWWTQLTAQSNAVRIAGHSPREVHDHAVRVGVTPSGLCVDRWSGTVDFALPPRGAMSALLAVQRTPEGWSGSATAVDGPHAFTYALRCAL